jgi:signal peptide peptidase SppA
MTIQPWLLDAHATAIASAALTARERSFAACMEGKPCAMTGDHAARTEEDFFHTYRVVDGVLHVPVEGVLLADTDFRIPSILTGYQYLERTLARAAEDPEVSEILLEVNSPGGHVKELENVTAAMRALNKPVTARVTDAMSAAYWLAAQADHIVARPSARVGSIGVIITHVSYEKMLDRAGLEVTIIHRGKHKADGSPYERLSESAREEFEKQADVLYDRFVAHVAKARGIPEDDVRATEARVFEGAEALEMGLIDAMETVGAAPRRKEEDMTTATWDKKDRPNAKGSAREPKATLPKEDLEKMEERAPALSADIDARAARNGLKVTKEPEADAPEADAPKAAAPEADAPKAEAPDGENTAACAAATERQRIRAIVTAPEAEGREQMAQALAFETALSPEEARKILAAAPKTSPKAEAPAPAPKSMFEQMMEAQTPVEAAKDIGEDAISPDTPDAQAADIIKAYKAMCH